jgi:hypothetical protein
MLFPSYGRGVEMTSAGDRQFAAFCVADSEVATAIEKIRPSNLGCRPDLGLSTVESLALFFEFVKHIDGYYYGAHFALYI